MSEDFTVNGKRVALSNLDKPLYPSGFTKGEMIHYYLAIAPVLLPHLKARAVTLKRYPNGTQAPFFFEKNCASHRSPWVKTASVTGKTGTVNHCVIGDLRTLIWVANLAALELHVPLATTRSISTPRAMVFDLDPGDGVDLRDCLKLGLTLREMLENLSLHAYPKTSGGKGLHVYVPLNSRGVTFDQTKAFAKAVAQILERRHPGKVLTSMTRSERAGKIFIDWSQNDQHKTTVCVYSLRGRDRPTISTPITWDEVRAGAKSRRSNVLQFESAAVLKRVQAHGDLFEALLTEKQSLPHDVLNAGK